MIARQSVQVKRHAAGSYGADGLWVEGAVTTNTIQASIQPASPRELARLPEGRSYSEAYTLYTDTELSADETVNADKVVLFGKDFTVVAVEGWRNGILPHFKAMVLR